VAAMGVSIAPLLSETVMKRYLLYLLLVATFWVSFQTSTALAAPPAQDDEVRAETYDIRPLEAVGMTITKDGVKIEGFQGTLESEPIVSDFDFMAVGVTWSEPLPETIAPLLSIRVSGDAGQTWGDWQPLIVGHDDSPDNRAATATELHFTEGNAIQLRATLQGVDDEPFVWEGVRLTVIDGSEGPTALQLAENRAQVEALGGGPYVISRAEWGANESYRFDSQGNEIWEREYYSLRAMFVHHTATNATYPDPAAAVRSIYYYHAITNGWGDIGYHYLVDQYGNIYQGRYGTEASGLVVEGGHALGYNRNTMGVSLIGNFVSSGPATAQMNSLKQLLADRAGTYGIDPFASVLLDGEGSTSPDRTFADSVLGHRDSHNPPRTTCPGDVLYNRLGEIRQYVADNSEEITDVQLVQPLTGATLNGNFIARSDATVNVVKVEYYLDDSYIGEATAAPWSITVDSASLPAGSHGLEARAFSASGGSDSDEHTITIAEVPIAGGLTAGGYGRPNAGFNLYLPMIIFTPPPPVCQELVPNHDFASNTGWLMLLSNYAARYAGEQSVSPPRSLRVGMAMGDNVNGFSSARVPFTVPANATSVTLTMHYLPKSGANPGSDGQYIGILDSAGTYIQSIIPYGQMNNYDSWAELTFDLASYKGQSIYLYVGAKNDGAGGTTSLYVDNVSIQACVPVQ
jgi:hypothetical protein